MNKSNRIDSDFIFSAFGKLFEIYLPISFIVQLLFNRKVNLEIVTKLFYGLSIK